MEFIRAVIQAYVETISSFSQVLCMYLSNCLMNFSPINEVRICSYTSISAVHVFVELLSELVLLMKLIRAVIQAYVETISSSFLNAVHVFV